jgi:hypothetical protein
MFFNEQTNSWHIKDFDHIWDIWIMNKNILVKIFYTKKSKTYKTISHFFNRWCKDKENFHLQDRCTNEWLNFVTFFWFCAVPILFYCLLAKHIVSKFPIGLGFRLSTLSWKHMYNHFLKKNHSLFTYGLLKLKNRDWCVDWRFIKLWCWHRIPN